MNRTTQITVGDLQRALLAARARLHVELERARLEIARLTAEGMALRETLDAIQHDPTR